MQVGEQRAVFYC